MSVNVGLWRTSLKLITPANNVFKPQVATIVSKIFRDPDYKRAKPFDYKNKTFNIFRVFDKCTPRFDENTKLITVDGAIASGKTKLAEDIAEKLDFHLIKAPDFNEEFITKAGYDKRQLNHLLAPRVQFLDIHDFLKDPTAFTTAKIQLKYFQLKLQRYTSALAHILNTGQGVVMDTSVYTDISYLETLKHFGFISKEVYSWFEESRENTIPFLMRPHVAIFLDLPVDDIIQRVNERNLPGEKGSAFLQPDVLAYLEKMHKTKFLTPMNEHAEVLVYDWSGSIDHQYVVDDLEQLEFDRYDIDSTKMKDWTLPSEDYWQGHRFLYTKNPHYFFLWSQILRFDVEELTPSYPEKRDLRLILDQTPETQYADGFNPNVGDSVLFKM